MTGGGEGEGGDRGVSCLYGWHSRVRRGRIRLYGMAKDRGGSLALFSFCYEAIKLFRRCGGGGKWGEDTVLLAWSFFSPCE